jgi:hypothetical protein
MQALVRFQEDPDLPAVSDEAAHAPGKLATQGITTASVVCQHCDTHERAPSLVEVICGLP